MTHFLVFMLSLHLVAARTGLPGFRGGPQDAFRHTLASAYISRYIGPWAVDAFTRWSETDNDSNYDLMDRHNNAVGRDIGQSEVSNLYEVVGSAVARGQAVDQAAQAPEGIIWLPPHKWANFLN